MEYTHLNIFRAQAELGEGPFWNTPTQKLGWVNILKGELHFLASEMGVDQVYNFNQYIGFAVPRASGEYLIGLQNGIANINLENTNLTWIAQPESNIPGNRFNDGKCSPDGRLFAGTMAVDERPEAGSLYRLDKDSSICTVISPVSISNGLAWSPDGRKLYYIDTPTSSIVAYDYDLQTGSIQNPHVVIRIPAETGWPDGMTIDHEGMLWIALWNGAKVVRYNPGNGQKIGEISLPALNVTSCTFGGPNYSRLFITTAWKGMTPQQRDRYPESGDIFAVDTDVQGRPVDLFQG